MNQRPSIRDIYFLSLCGAFSEVCEISLFNQILACAERLARARYNCYAKRGLSVEPLQKSVSFPVCCIGQGVHGLGPIDRDEDYMVGWI